MTPRARRGLLWFLAGGALTLLVGRWMSGLYADWAFYHALGFDAVWRSKALHGATLASGAFVVAATFAFANLFAVRQSIVSLVLPRQLGNIEFGEAVPSRRLTLLAAALAAGLGVLFALLPHDWASAAVAWDGIRFGEIDPYLERDLGFYATWLPWEMALQARLTALTLVVSGVVVALYASTPSVKWGDEGLYVSAWVRRHLAILAGALILLVGWDWRLDRFARLSEGSGIFFGAASETAFAAFDHRVALGYLAAASFACIPIAVVFVWAGWRANARLALALISALILGGPVAGALTPLVRRDSMAPDARATEQPYRATGILYTRRAYGVDEIATDTGATLARLSPRELGSRVSVWDPAALDRWHSTGARDTAPAFLAWEGTEAGLSATLLRASATGRTVGGPWSTRLVDPTTADPDRRPALAVGVVGRSVERVVSSPGTAPAALIADTTGGVAAPKFEGTVARLALSWALQDPRLFVAAAPAPRPKLVLHRDVRDRLARAVPFLEAGPTVTPILRGDSLYWVVELFSVADYYPLTERMPFDGRERHYVRHAATALVQGQTGRIVIAPVERPDAVTAALMKQYPGLFAAPEAIPEWFADARPPALDWGLVQGRAMARAGLRGDTVTQRSLTRADDADADVAVGAATYFQLDSAGGLAWGVPVDLPWAGRTVGLLVVRGGRNAGTEYHRADGPRWTTVLEQLQGAADAAGISRDLVHARRGRIQAIPTTEGPAWVQSFYDWSPDVAPRLTGVAVTVGGVTRIGPTISAALGVRDAAAPRPVADAVFRARVAALYASMEAALRAGDWRAYGEAWAALGRLVGRP